MLRHITIKADKVSSVFNLEVCVQDTAFNNIGHMKQRKGVWKRVENIIQMWSQRTHWSNFLVDIRKYRYDLQKNS